MPEQVSFDYAVVRVVPRVDREEFINVGVIVFARTQKYLAARVALDRDRLLALAPNVDLTEIERHLEQIPKICAGSSGAGPIAQLPQHERWHWLVAPKSTIIQMSSVHSGLCSDPAAELDHLMQILVL
ncbi:MAG: DUF3037 domain-containing protein [Bacteroidota bacterium]|nr:DUF3037 domain-containing protein [Bacteroidota bacterium]MDP4232031.1 DUF3037 domain-containing protein [Bacteroidota bacterium]MDP4241262.1 DUF3037 domain-containing protein [Bacteroidota bacterium]MDP4286654.1 DUF3037 domain-containing protein [Bacteroidota bacterium]